MTPEQSKALLCPVCDTSFTKLEEFVEHVNTHLLSDELRRKPPYDLPKYESAFALLGQGDKYKTQIPEFIRQAMVFVALRLPYHLNGNREAVQRLFGSTSGLRWNDSAIMMCLNKIRQTHYHGKPKEKRASV